MHEVIADKSKDDAIISAGMLADRLRPLVLASCDGEPPHRFGSSCLNGSPMIPIHRATLGSIYQHLERIAAWDNERTISSLESEIHALETSHSQRLSEARENLADRVTMAAEYVEPLPVEPVMLTNEGKVYGWETPIGDDVRERVKQIILDCTDADGNDANYAAQQIITAIGSQSIEGRIEKIHAENAAASLAKDEERHA